MRRLSVVTLCVGLLAVLAAAAHAVSVSGVLIYAADKFGNPSAADAQGADSESQPMWHTQLDDAFHGLGILAGSPPQSVAGPLLNAADFTVNLPLSPGENEFTLVGEPDEKYSGRPFDDFVLNLYFDGRLDQPGISVLFPRRGSSEGDVPEPNPLGRVFALTGEAVPGTPTTSFDDGTVHVSVDAVSFGPPQWPLIVDRVSAHALKPGDGKDWIGVLALFVDASSAPAPRAGRIGLETGRVNAGATVRVGPDLSGTVPGTGRGEAQGGVELGEGQTASAGTPTPMDTATAATPTRASVARATGTHPGRSSSTPTPPAAATASTRIMRTPTPVLVSTPQASRTAGAV
jgi:hypothetical protein